jgi:hypothetical protein
MAGGSSATRILSNTGYWWSMQDDRCRQAPLCTIHSQSTGCFMPAFGFLHRDIACKPHPVLSACL